MKKVKTIVVIFLIISTVMAISGCTDEEQTTEKEIEKAADDAIYEIHGVSLPVTCTSYFESDKSAEIRITDTIDLSYDESVDVILSGIAGVFEDVSSDKVMEVTAKVRSEEGYIKAERTYNRDDI